jgi:uncharacterized membrane protein YidH (DUF202 family)
MTTVDRGLQAQRTSLSWTRTAFAVLGNGALLMLRDIRDHKAGFGLAAAGVALAVALLVYLVGLRRQRALARQPLPSRIAPSPDVYVVTAGVVILVVVSVLSLVL